MFSFTSYEVSLFKHSYLIACGLIESIKSHITRESDILES